MDANRALRKSIEESLNSLGRQTMQTIMWQMSENGVNIRADNFDINKFVIILRGFFGEGSESLLNMIYKNMCRHLKIDPQTDQSLTVLENIKRIFESEKKMSS